MGRASDVGAVAVLHVVHRVRRSADLHAVLATVGLLQRALWDAAASGIRCRDGPLRAVGQLPVAAAVASVVCVWGDRMHRPHHGP